MLTQQEAFELSQILDFIEVSYVSDSYDGEKRIRTQMTGETSEKTYPTPVSGVATRFSAKCRLGEIENVWFEVKWTNSTTRFEIEFEGDVPERFKDRPNIKGWDILNS